MADTTKNSKPNKEEIARLKNMGIDPKQLMPKGNQPKLEVSKYDLKYDGEELIKLTKYNADGTLDFVDTFENKGKKQIRDWYINNKLYRQSTTEFITKFHKEKYYGWEVKKDGKKSKWNYRFEYEFDEQKNVISYTRYDNEEQKETVKYVYNENGLLTDTEGYLIPDHFEYEYY